MTQQSQRAMRIVRGRALAVSGEGQRIRERANLSQRQSAEAIGVAASTLGRWESGESTPRGSEAERYERFISELEAEVPA